MPTKSSVFKYKNKKMYLFMYVFSNYCTVDHMIFQAYKTNFTHFYIETKLWVQTTKTK